MLAYAKINSWLIVSVNKRDDVATNVFAVESVEIE